MNRSKRRPHSIDSLFTMLLFGLYALFILLILLFAARLYRINVHSFTENQNLHTAMDYIAAKFRQHEKAEDVFIEDNDAGKCLCFRDSYDGISYITYLYFDGKNLKELFTLESLEPPFAMGTPLSSLSSFAVNELPSGLISVTLSGDDDRSSTLVLHPGPPGA